MSEQEILEIVIAYILIGFVIAKDGGIKADDKDSENYLREKLPNYYITMKMATVILWLPAIIMLGFKIKRK